MCIPYTGVGPVYIYIYIYIYDMHNSTLIHDKRKAMDAAKRYLNDAKTLKQSLIRALALYSYRELSDDGLTYLDFHQDIAKWANIIRSKTKDFPEKTVAIVGECRLSWVMAEFACTFARRATVGVHTEWPQSEIEYILSNADAGLLIILEVTSDVERLARDSAAAIGISVLSLSEDIPVLSAEALCSPYDMIPMPSDMELANETEEEADCNLLFSIMYTSGTTGRPKGVPVSRGLWRKNSINGPGGSSVKPRVIVYNSLAHGADRGRVWQTCMAGGKISFSSEGNLIDDIIARKPTNLFAFGNFWNEVYLRCMNDSKLRQNIGTVAQHVELIATGGTFTSLAALQYLEKLFFNAKISDSYGTTEAPGISANGNFVDGGYDLKLVDVPSQNYFAAEGFGEIVVRDRGEYATRSYWKDPTATAAAWDDDGWYATGDIGQVKDGKLIIVGRRSNLVELYVDGRSVWVSSSKLEDEIFKQSDLVSSIFIWGDRMNDFLVAVVIPSSDKATTDSLLADFKTIGNSKGLHPWEIPSAVILVPYGTYWSSSNGLLTSTSKLKRNALYAKYQEQITKLCAEITGVSYVSDMNRPNLLEAQAPVPVPALDVGPMQSKISEPECEHITDIRVWQNQNIDGITDYLDFKFKAADSDQAEEMNGVKRNMDSLVRRIRPYLKEIDAIYAAKYTRIDGNVGRNSEISEKLVVAILSVKEKGPALDSAIENWFARK
jgi:long-chain acyl-CoA synthetase